VIADTPYVGLEAEGYISKTVNHSEQFVDSVTGVYWVYLAVDAA